MNLKVGHIKVIGNRLPHSHAGTSQRTGRDAGEQPCQLRPVDQLAVQNTWGDGTENKWEMARLGKNNTSFRIMDLLKKPSTIWEKMKNLFEH